VNQSPIATAIGSGLAIGGGVIAQAPDASVGTVGIVVAIGGIITAVFGGIGQIVKTIADARTRRLEEQVKELEEDLAGSRKRRHDEAGRFNGLLLDMQARQQELESRALVAERKAADAAILAAHLEGRLGRTDRIHGEAINANIENISLLADRTGTSLPAQPPHVAPIPPRPPPILPILPVLETDDDFTLPINPQRNP
jgi:hypothetical protein